jgi:hypothetical protein
MIPNIDVPQPDAEARHTMKTNAVIAARRAVAPAASLLFRQMVDVRPDRR